MSGNISVKQTAIKAIELLNRLLKPLNFQLVWYSEFDRALEREMPAELGSPSFRELIAVQAVATPAEVSIEEARFLGELIGRTDPADPIIEIGTLFGHSTSVMTMFKAPEQPLIGVDNFSWNPLDISPAYHEYAARRVLAQATELYNVTVKNTDKQEFFDSYDGPPPALVFCDADHSTEATLADINWARSVGAKIICGHDYGEDPRVSAAVDQLGGPKELVGRVFVI
jgi:predicted O-methyltransferase YrrM